MTQLQAAKPAPVRWAPLLEQYFVAPAQIRWLNRFVADSNTNTIRRRPPTAIPPPAIPALILYATRPQWTGFALFSNQTKVTTRNSASALRLKESAPPHAFQNILSSFLPPIARARLLRDRQNRPTTSHRICFRSLLVPAFWFQIPPRSLQNFSPAAPATPESSLLQPKNQRLMCRAPGLPSPAVAR